MIQIPAPAVPLALVKRLSKLYGQAGLKKRRVSECISRFAG